MGKNDFQTPIWCCEYMKTLIPDNVKTILEPTSGLGNILSVLTNDYKITAPKNFWKLDNNKFDCVIMNPPFTPMMTGYMILYRCMELSDNIIALMPWLTLINSENRTKDIIDYGLKSVTHLPRSTFKGSRVQTCILEMKKGYNNKIEFKLKGIEVKFEH